MDICHSVFSSYSQIVPFLLSDWERPYLLDSVKGIYFNLICPQLSLEVVAAKLSLCHHGKGEADQKAENKLHAFFAISERKVFNNVFSSSRGLLLQSPFPQEC